jgi:hypothetical protein
MYTVFVQSQLLNVQFILELQLVQLVGFSPFQYAIYTDSFNASVGQIMFNVIFFPVVYVALLLILKLPPTGGVLSI